jgi:predicted RNase H-like HicB family nuclease
MKLSYVYWKDGEWYLGYLEDYPDHWTQGKTLEELEFMLKDLYALVRPEEAPKKISRGELVVA